MLKAIEGGKCRLLIGKEGGSCGIIGGPSLPFKYGICQVNIRREDNINQPMAISRASTMACRQPHEVVQGLETASGRL